MKPFRMSRGLFKKLRTSLVAQMVVVVLAALMIAQAVSFIILGNAYRTALSDISQRSQFQQIESLVWLLENNPMTDYPAILAAARTKTVWFSVDENSELSGKKMNGRDQALVRRLQDLLGADYKDRIWIKVDTSRAFSDSHNKWKPKAPCVGDGCNPFWQDDQKKNHQKRAPHDDDRKRRYFRDGWKPPIVTSLQISVQMRNNLWLNLKAKSPAAPPLVAKQTVVFLIIATILVLCALAIMVRRITRPLRMLSKASIQLGLGEQVEPLPETGPADVKETIRAFNQMNDRLQRFVSDRTRMLAALSHDLRTPITTMRLRVELMSESRDRDQLLATLEEMQQMSEATLAFMRQASDNETTRTVDLNAMVGSLCDDLEEVGLAVGYEDSLETVIRCRPVSLKRALRNLIENGVKYGRRVEVRLEHTVRSGQHFASVVIDDHGPGIPEEMVEQVFVPFFRLEGSRNRDTGGVGLGLAIARNIVRNHGGEIYLENRGEGLRVRVELPLM